MIVLNIIVSKTLFELFNRIRNIGSNKWQDYEKYSDHMPDYQGP